MVEPGISIANKYQAPSLEGLTDSPITESQLTRIVKKDASHNLGLESSQAIAKEVMDTLGWNLPKGVSASFTNW